MSDSLIQRLNDLAPAVPDRARAERIRMRCRARLAQEAARASASDIDAAAHARTVHVWQPLAAVLGAAYLTSVIIQVLGVYGLP